MTRIPDIRMAGNTPLPARQLEGRKPSVPLGAPGASPASDQVSLRFSGKYDRPEFVFETIEKGWSTEKRLEKYLKKNNLSSLDGIRDGFGRTPFMHWVLMRWAPQDWFFDMVMDPAEFHVADKNGVTALMMALDPSTVMDVNKEGITTDYVDFLLRNRHELENPRVVNAEDNEGKTALFYAINAHQPFMDSYPDVHLNRAVSAIGKLLDNGADPDHRDDLGRDLFMFAVAQKRFDVLEYLLSDDAFTLDLETKDEWGETLVDYVNRYAKDRAQRQAVIARLEEAASGRLPETLNDRLAKLPPHRLNRLSDLLMERLSHKDATGLVAEMAARLDDDEAVEALLETVETAQE